MQFVCLIGSGMQLTASSMVWSRSQTLGSKVAHTEHEIHIHKGYTRLC